MITACAIFGSGLLASSVYSAEVPASGTQPSQDGNSPTLEDLRRTIDAQSQLLQEQIRALEEKSRKLAEQLHELQAQQPQLAFLPAPRATSFDLGSLSGMGSGEPDSSSEKGPGSRVGTAPKSQSSVGIATLADRGGVLTPRGVLTIEPELEFRSTGIRRFDFQGIEVANSILVGEIDASESDRDGYISTLNARYGLTSRLEASIKVPYLRRRDRMTSRVVNQGQPAGLTRSRGGTGLGDIELGLHYQFRRTSARWPILIGNLRVKSDTGKSPFDVDRDSRGIESELPTGSGSWSIEPSLTAIYPTDPAVLYGSLSYAYNFKESVDRVLNSAAGPVRVGDVDPGDSVGLSFGLGLGLNEKASLNLGYSHQYLMRTTTELEGQEFDSNVLHVGELQFGLSYQLSRRSTIQLTFAAGVTEAAPDLRIALRIPMTWRIFD